MMTVGCVIRNDLIVFSQDLGYACHHCLEDRIEVRRQNQLVKLDDAIDAFKEKAG